MRFLVPLLATVSCALATAQATESDFLSNIRQLTFEGARAGEGYFNADGSKLVFQSERSEGNPFFQIYLLDLETGDTSRISPGHGKTTCAWIHPDDNRVLYASTQDDPNSLALQKAEYEERASGTERRYAWDYDPHFDLFEYNIEKGDYRNLTKTKGYDAEGAYSPDGEWIVFASNRHAYDGTDKLSKADEKWFAMNPSSLMDIYIMRTDGSDLKRLTKTKGYDGGPFFDHDGTKITWRRFNEKGDKAEIWTMNTDGSDQKQITRLGAMSWAPYFHPSGEYLVFATNLQGFANFEVYLVDADGEKEPVRVTDTDGFDGLPVFSPNGTQFAWTTNRTPDDKSQIFLADWNHQAALDALKLAPASSADEPAPTPKPTVAQTSTTSDINPSDIESHIAYLVSDELEGRLTGTKGEQLATQYVADLLQSFGLEPAGDNDTYFQEFEFTAGVDLGPDNTITVTGLKNEASPETLEPGKDWIPLSFSSTGDVEPAEIVFAGYGIEAPAEVGEDGEEFGLYTSYYQTDVEGKWVMMFRYYPEEVSTTERQRFTRYANPRHKALAARQKSAHGIILVTGPNAPAKDKLVPLSFDASLAGSGIPAISISDELADQILANAGKTLKELQDQLDTGSMMIGTRIPDVKVGAHIDVVQEKKIGRNVLAKIASPNPDAPAVLIGAHVDHLGSDAGATSRATDEEKDQVHYGADDNASGIAGLLEIAEYLSDQNSQGNLDLKRDAIFAAWSGEELGLLGSSAFVRTLLKPIDSNTAKDESESGSPSSDAKIELGAALNMDMIGRLRDSLILQGVASSSVWPSEIEKRNVPVGLPITTQDDVYLSTDATNFYLAGVPILSAFTGAHSDYHTPRDTIDLINFDGTAKTSRLMALIMRSLLTAEDTPDYQKVEKPASRGSRSGLRAYLGTVPDYAQEDVEGVKITGTSKNSPAEKAGLQAGDVIVELGGKEILNIYDYSALLGALKIDEETSITVERDGERIPLKITPASRD
ncbi:MAG: M28 family peptidase [Verrucomicrobiota bacterium]